MRRIESCKTRDDLGKMEPNGPRENSTEWEQGAKINMSEIRTAPRGNSATISLACLFQIVTACCIFFACLSISPVLAIVGTLISAPALIRTGWAADLHHRSGMTFGWKTRLLCFAETLLIEFITLMFSLAVFSVVSLMFGALAVCFSLLYGSTDAMSDIAVVGTAGGMIWGFAGAILAVGYTAKLWKVRSHLEPIAQ